MFVDDVDVCRIGIAAHLRAHKPLSSKDIEDKSLHLQHLETRSVIVELVTMFESCQSRASQLPTIWTTAAFALLHDREHTHVCRARTSKTSVLFCNTSTLAQWHRGGTHDNVRDLAASCCIFADDVDDCPNRIVVLSRTPEPLSCKTIKDQYLVLKHLDTFT